MTEYSALEKKLFAHFGFRGEWINHCLQASSLYNMCMREAFLNPLRYDPDYIWALRYSLVNMDKKVYRMTPAFESTLEIFIAAKPENNS